MMVSKIAVMALVAIIATPILLGYAMNITETTETDWRTTGDSVNVTPLLQNGSEYTYASSDVYAMNTRFTLGGKSSPMLPMYESFMNDTKSSFKLRHLTYAAGSHPFENIPLDTYNYYYFQSTDEGSGGHINVQIKYSDDNPYMTISEVRTFYYIDSEKTFYYSRGSNFSTSSISIPAGYKFHITDSGGYTGTTYIEWDRKTAYATETYVDFSGGFRFHTDTYTSGYLGGMTNLPNYARSVLFTIDLSSITDNSYAFNISNVLFTKTTTGGVVKWTVSQYNTATPFDPFDIYYDNSSSNNTYQFRMTADTNGRSVGSGMKAYDITYQFRYVGEWPTIIGEANYYQEYVVDSEIIQVGSLNLSRIGIGQKCEITPIIRIDDVLYRAFEYPVILDKTYTPSEFKTNPSTTINDPYMIGKSIEFGGNTYTVDSDGNITLGSHKVPVKGLTLSSIPDGNGNYDNKIGNTVISTTATPSTIKFNGQWSASITTESMESYTYSKSVWHAGEFGWDGVDQNFLIVGLITCLGVFIALGIYARKRGTGGLIPLMIVTGCAAAVFFIML